MQDILTGIRSIEKTLDFRQSRLSPPGEHYPPEHAELHNLIDILSDDVAQRLLDFVKLWIKGPQPGTGG